MRKFFLMLMILFVVFALNGCVGAIYVGAVNDKSVPTHASINQASKVADDVPVSVEYLLEERGIPDKIDLQPNGKTEVWTYKPERKSIVELLNLGIIVLIPIDLGEVKPGPDQYTISDGVVTMLNRDEQKVYGLMCGLGAGGGGVIPFCGSEFGNNSNIVRNN